jgi:hypothetical protein
VSYRLCFASLLVLQVPEHPFDHLFSWASYSAQNALYNVTLHKIADTLYVTGGCQWRDSWLPKKDDNHDTPASAVGWEASYEKLLKLSFVNTCPGQGLR